MRMTLIAFSMVVGGWAFADEAVPLPSATDLAVIETGWQGTVVARLDQSYAGWDVELGDADNDGKNEILTTGCPDSRLYLFKDEATRWKTVLLADNLAGDRPAMGLTVRVADLNGDAKNEVLLGTGQEKGGTAWFHVLSTDGRTLTNKLSCRPECNKSSFTHNLAIHDLNGDGVKEVISAYCGGGEVIRYDVNKSLTAISARKIHQLSGSGEESIVADVDNDGKFEYLTANGFRPGKARVEIFDFDDRGELAAEPRIAMAGYEGNGCFYTSFTVGDVNNDGRNELVVGWKREQKVNLCTLAAYSVVKTEAVPIAWLERDTSELDMGYFEKMMAVADADNDGRNELVISTRGDNVSEFITSDHLGRVYIYRLDADGKSARETLVDFREEHAESAWLAVGDADNDNLNEVVVATGRGDRTKPGVSYVVMLERTGGAVPK
jgi:hypothetical protein